MILHCRLNAISELFLPIPKAAPLTTFGAAAPWYFSNLRVNVPIVDATRESSHLSSTYITATAIL